MFAWVGSKFDAILSNYVLNVVVTLMTAIAPCFRLLVALPIRAPGQRFPTLSMDLSTRAGGLADTP